MQTFKPADFHRRYYKVLNDFAEDRIEKLMIFMSPQHGKSEGSTRRLPSYVLGRKPDTKIAVVPYNAPKTRKSNRGIQGMIDSPEYHGVFPDACLNSSNVTIIAGSWLRNAGEFEIVGHRGSAKTVGIGGPLTGEPVDILIMNGVYKDAKSTWSPVVREAIEDWYDTVAETRLHNDSQQLIVFTRWHEHDLARRLLEQQGRYSEDNPGDRVVVMYQAIKVGAPSEYDPREEGEALWPGRHNLTKLQSTRKRSPHVFGSLYQQDPEPVGGLICENPFNEYEIIPYCKRMIRKNYTDTADGGGDFLCSICHVEAEARNYVLDVLYVQKGMEYIEPKTAEILSKHNIQGAVVESNNNGRDFARNAGIQCRVMGNNKTKIKWFHQKDNKAIRIYRHSAVIQNLPYSPKGWEYMWPEFHEAITNYVKVGKNDHDDASDALTGTVEKRKRSEQ